MDLSKLSDADLQKMYSQPAQKSPASMSDSELQAAYATPQRGAVDKLFGLTGERYQTWPEKAVRSIASIPERAVSGAMSGPVGSEETAEAMIPATVEAAMMAGINPAIRAGDRVIPGVAKAFKAEAPVVPTTQELVTAGGSAINAAKASELKIGAQTVGEYSRKLQQELFDSGIHPARAGDTYKILKELENAPADAVFTPANLQTLRETLQSVAQNFNPNASKDQLAASRAIKGFDQFLPSVGPKDTVAGAIAADSAPATREQLLTRALEGKKEAGRVTDLFEQGRGNYAAAMRSNDITGVLDRANTGILERAEVRAQAANSGRNLDNTIRSKVASVLEKPKEISGLSDDELASLNSVIEGGSVRNTARTVGNWLGGGGGLGQTSVAALGAAAGASVGGVPGAIVGAGAPLAVGTGAKAVANVLAKRSLSKADEAMRMRSPLYQDRVANPEMTARNADGMSPAMATIVQALIEAQKNDNQAPESVRSVVRALQR